MSREAMQMALEALEFYYDQHSEESDARVITALREALEAEKQEPVAWTHIDTAPKGRIVLVHYKNSLGNGRTMRARYYLPETLDSDSTESGWADEGWYEESEAYEYLMPLEYEPTHWMPLPAAPDTQLTHTAPPKTEQEQVECMCGICKLGKREWVGLTDFEIEDLYFDKFSMSELKDFARAIEARLKEKNHG